MLLRFCPVALDGRTVRRDARDRGIGIDPDEAPRIFARLRGRFGVGTAVGAGSTFTITLPLAGPTVHNGAE